MCVWLFFYPSIKVALLQHMTIKKRFTSLQHGCNIVALFKCIPNPNALKCIVKFFFFFFVHRLSTSVGNPNLSMQVKLQPTYLTLGVDFCMYGPFLSHSKDNHTQGGTRICVYVFASVHMLHVCLYKYRLKNIFIIM